MSVDDALISTLLYNGRASYQELAKAAGVPRTTASVRVQELIETGRIKVTAAVDPNFLGDKVIAHVSLTTEGPVADIAEAIAGIEDTALVTATSGEHSVITEIRVPDHTQLHSTLDRIRTIPGVLSLDTIIYSEVLKGLFITNFSGDRTIDEMDIAIINLLRADGRMPYSTIASRVNLSPTAVRNRVTNLLAAGVMRISAALPRTSSGPHLMLGVGLNLRAAGKSFTQTLTSLRACTFAARTVGRFDMVATFMTAGPQDAFNILEDVRRLRHVGHFESWEHLVTFKDDYSRKLDTYLK